MRVPSLFGIHRLTDRAAAVAVVMQPCLSSISAVKISLVGDDIYNRNTTVHLAAWCYYPNGWIGCCADISRTHLSLSLWSSFRVCILATQLITYMYMNSAIVSTTRCRILLGRVTSLVSKTYSQYICMCMLQLSIAETSNGRFHSNIWSVSYTHLTLPTKRIV